MSEFKGTPGPWVFDSDYGLVGSESAEAGRADVVCLPPDSWSHLSREFWPANARLIAAAPDLLEALTRLRDCYSTSHSPATRQSCWDQAIAAIAKATGEQP